MRMRLVSHQFEVFVFEIEDIGHFRIEFHLGQGKGLSAELQFYLVQVVEVDVRITEGMDELAGMQTRSLCHHHGEQGVGCNVERYTEENITAALVHLAGELAIGHIKLEKCVTWGKGCLPGGYIF